jgi:DNA repair exonuclease SbcCD ATPase subunit
VTRPGKKKPCPDTPGLVSAVTTVASTKDDALQILSVYLKSIKPLSEDQMLRKRREKLEKRELELAQGKEALQTLGLEIQGNYKKLTASKKASKDTAQKREIDKDIEKVTVGSRALIQIGQKLEVQKERLLVERKLLEEDEKTLRNAAKSLPSPVQF